jgi:ribosomal-protein-alanine N-acetyltransferase
MRPLQEKDIESLLHLHADVTTRRYAWVDNLQSREANLEWIKDQQHLYREGMGLFAIEATTGNTFLGVCGLRKRNDLLGAVDMSYRIIPAYRYMGFATEAAKAMLEYGFGTLSLHQLVAQVHRDNFASRRIMYRLGFESGDNHKNWMLYKKESEQH